MSYGSRTTAAGASGQGAAGGGGGAVGAVGGADVFTPEMRDRQARGKDPYESSDSSDWTGGPLGYRAGGGKDEPFSILERRRVAAQVLDSPELLMMAAQRDNQSMPATRLRYQRMLCGISEPPAPAPARKRSHHHHAHHPPHATGGTPGRRKEAW
ncbi:hypothetical protein F4779DRAFT_441780 [Xylariaceae sp. FL0662B]|nr:hypothetical protein F4779DRAFT_441780 [Xylariaceae sp. FL0662B]